MNLDLVRGDSGYVIVFEFNGNATAEYFKSEDDVAAVVKLAGAMIDSEFVGNVILKGDAGTALLNFFTAKNISGVEGTRTANGIVMKMMKHHCVPALEYAIEFLRARGISDDVLNMPVPTVDELRQLFKPTDEMIKTRRINLAELIKKINADHKKDNFYKIRTKLVYSALILRGFNQKFCYDWAMENKFSKDFNRLFEILKINYVLADVDFPFDEEIVSHVEKSVVHNIKKFYPADIPREDWTRDFFAECKDTPFGTIAEYTAVESSWQDDKSQGFISEVATAKMLFYSTLEEFREVNQNVYRFNVYRRKSDNKIYFAYSAVKQIHKIICDEEGIPIIEQSEYEKHKVVIDFFGDKNVTLIYDAHNPNLVDTKKLDTPEVAVQSVESYTREEILTCLNILKGELHYEEAR